MLNELDIVRDVSQRLEGAGLAYMLTGSMAMNYYAQPRMTRDIDLVVALSAADADTVVRTFTGDYYVSPVAVADSIALQSLFNLIHEESVIKVDCIVRKDSPYRGPSSNGGSAFAFWISPHGSRARKTLSSQSSSGLATPSPNNRGVTCRILPPADTTPLT